MLRLKPPQPTLPVAELEKRLHLNARGGSIPVRKPYL